MGLEALLLLVEGGRPGEDEVVPLSWLLVWLREGAVMDGWVEGRRLVRVPTPSEENGLVFFFFEPHSYENIKV